MPVINETTVFFDCGVRLADRCSSLEVIQVEGGELRAPEYQSPEFSRKGMKCKTDLLQDDHLPQERLTACL